MGMLVAKQLPDSIVIADERNTFEKILQEEKSIFDRRREEHTRRLQGFGLSSPA
jgi:hypothetical protein